MANEFEGRQFVITGGAGGIGRACARDLLARGARVLLVDIDTGRLDQVKNELGGGDRLAAYVSRIASPAEAAAALFQVITQRYLKTSIVMTTNLGVASWGKIFDDPTVAAAMLAQRFWDAASNFAH